MMEYYYADRLRYAVAGTPNLLEHDQGFFVKPGDGAADLKPIAHLYKSQVYQLAEYLGVPEEIRRAQADDRHLFARAVAGGVLFRPVAGADRPVPLRAGSRRFAAAEAAPAVGLTRRAGRTCISTSSIRSARRRDTFSSRPARDRSGGPRMTWTRLQGARRALARIRRCCCSRRRLLRRVPFRPVDIGKLCFLQLNGVPDVPPRWLRGHAEVERSRRMPTISRPRRGFRTRAAHFPRALRRRGPLRRRRSSMTGSSATNGSPRAPSTTRRRGAIRSRFPAASSTPTTRTSIRAYRNTGLWLRFKASLAEWMAARGKRGVLTFVDYGNWPSLRTHLRFGFEPTESVVAVRVIGLRLFRKVARLARRRGPSSHGWRCIRRRCTCITPRERSTSPWRSSAGNQALGGAGARSSRMRSWARRCQSSNRDGP